MNRWQTNPQSNSLHNTPKNSPKTGRKNSRVSISCGSLLSRLPKGVLAVGLGSLMAFSAASSAAGASTTLDLDNPLGAAQEAASTHSFDATLTTSWLSQNGLRTRRITVRADGELVDVLGERRLRSSRSLRAVQTGDVWRSIWNSAASLRGPALSKKYVVTVGGASSVAGRATTQVFIADRRGRVRDLIDLDSENGLMLRREQRDENGDVLRITAFEKISAVKEAEKTRGEIKYSDSKKDSGSPREALAIEAPFMLYKTLPGGFVLVGKYVVQGNGRELFYSDGLNSVSVFEWEGSIEPGSLPAGGKWHRAPNGEMRSYDSPVGTVSVWDADGMTFTVVSEATALETARIVSALPQDTNPQGLERISRFLIGPFSWG